MNAPVRPPVLTTRATVAVLLIVLGAASWVLAGVVSRPHAYSAGRPPPASVTVTEGRQYSIDTAGGLAAANGYARGANLQCSITDEAGATSPLSIAAETNEKALHRIATFAAPVSGRVRVACSAAGPVYVDDADGTVDGSGLLRLLAAVLLAVGLPLGLSAIAARRMTQPVPEPEHA